jgi:histidinol dehydrogenase
MLIMEILRFDRSWDKIKKIVNRGMSTDARIIESVKNIVKDVKEHGDDAIARYSLQFDNFDLKTESMVVYAETLEECFNKADPAFIELIREAASNIREFHTHQVEKTWTSGFAQGVRLGQKITPLDRVAVYVPGGKAFYPSTAIMNIVPAQVAGVGEIIVMTPPARFMENPIIGATLYMLGIRTAYLVGGAQAIAGAAFGTETIPKADKVVGPGNIYVATAKREVYGYVDIDMIAGPSEVVVLASGRTNPNPVWIALDLLSQAEHRTGYESAILITDSEELAQNVQKAIESELEMSPYKNIINQILDDYGAIIVTNNIAQGVDLVNKIAPEHLEILVDDEDKVVDSIRHAGAIFIGEYSSEPVGDYWAGPNHVLPTGGTARFFSPLGVYDFVKRSSLIYYNKKALIANAEKISEFAKREDFYFHGKAVLKRYEDITGK